MSTAVEIDAVNTFCAFTSAPPAIAKRYLSAAGWNAEQAVDNFFQHPPDEDELRQAQGDFEPEKISTLFELYRDRAADDDVINTDGIERLSSDLGIDADDIVLLALAWKMDAKVMGEFSRTEFLRGLTELRIDNIDALKEYLNDLRAELASPVAFKNFYLYVFTLALSDGATALPVDDACALWPMLLTNKFGHLDWWLDFVANVYNKGITKDAWAMLYDFGQLVNDDMSNYDADEAWPLIIDEFVEWCEEEKGVRA